MKLEHLWLACPLPAVGEDRTVYADRLPLGSPFPLKMLKHGISVESGPAEPCSPSLKQSTPTKRAHAAVWPPPKQTLAPASSSSEPRGGVVSDVSRGVSC